MRSLLECLRRLEDKVSSLADELHALEEGSDNSSHTNVFVNGDRVLRSGDRPVFPRKLRGTPSRESAINKGLWSYHERFGDDARSFNAGCTHFASTRGVNSVRSTLCTIEYSDCQSAKVRSAVKEDIGYSNAEFLYGEPLCLPGEFFDENADGSSVEKPSYNRPYNV